MPRKSYIDLPLSAESWHSAMEDLIEGLLYLIDKDPEREGLKETPRRVARFWEEFIKYDPGNLDVTFEAVTVDQLVVVKEMPFYSLCEHHLLPIIGTATVGYLSGEKVLGLSKIARIVQMCAHRLQLQERMANEIADEMQRIIGKSLVGQVSSVAVVLEADHLCMQMRGIKSQGRMVTAVMRGEFRTVHDLKEEFLMLGGIR